MSYATIALPGPSGALGLEGTVCRPREARLPRLGWVMILALKRAAIVKQRRQFLGASQVTLCRRGLNQPREATQAEFEILSRVQLKWPPTGVATVSNADHTTSIQG
jgi:hypothetical protein